MLIHSDSHIRYEKAEAMPIADQNMAILMVEAGTTRHAEAKGALGFSLKYPRVSSVSLCGNECDFISEKTIRIDVIRYGMDDELLKLKG